MDPRMFMYVYKLCDKNFQCYKKADHQHRYVLVYLLPVVPTFIYYSIICLDFLTGGTARFTLVHIPLDPVVTFPPLPMPEGPALFSNKYLLLPIRPII